MLVQSSVKMELIVDRSSDQTIPFAARMAIVANLIKTIGAGSKTQLERFTIE
jgi:hypothetical protein